MGTVRSRTKVKHHLSIHRRLRVSCDLYAPVFSYITGLRHNHMIECRVKHVSPLSIVVQSLIIEMT